MRFGLYQTSLDKRVLHFKTMYQPCTHQLLDIYSLSSGPTRPLRCDQPQTTKGLSQSRPIVSTSKEISETKGIYGRGLQILVLAHIDWRIRQPPRVHHCTIELLPKAICEVFTVPEDQVVGLHLGDDRRSYWPWSESSSIFRQRFASSAFITSLSLLSV